MGPTSSPAGRAPALPALLRGRAAQHPSRPALILVDDGETETGRLSWAEFDAATLRVAAALADRGLAGERVLIACPSPRDFMVGFLGCLRAGAIAVPVPAGAANRLGERVRAIAADCAPGLVLTGADVRPGSDAEALRGLPWATVAACEAGPDAPEQSVDPDAVAMLQYTSGSTRRPRGVALTHANLLANLEMLQAAAGLGSGRGAETTVSWMPLHHDMGLIAMALQTLHGGGTCVLMRPLHFVQRPLRWLACMSRYGATLSGAPTFAYRLCVERARAGEVADLDLSAWRCAIVAAEPVRAEVLDAFADTFRAVGFRRDALFPA
ncbi:MAG: AMP-binding protein, partial [Alphaproteobacteria bacterium]